MDIKKSLRKTPKRFLKYKGHIMEIQRIEM